MGRLIEETDGDVVVDLTPAARIDSVTLGVLMGAARELEPRGGRIAIVAGDEIRDALLTAGVERSFVVAATVDDALAKLGVRTTPGATPPSSPQA
jgi:anti-anti-sigma regulatory factor